MIGGRLGLRERRTPRPAPRAPSLGEPVWAIVAEFGEDYSTWLSRYEREKQGNAVIVRLWVELQTPAAIRSGNQPASRRIKARSMIR